jgi:hypothetical protein
MRHGAKDVQTGNRIDCIVSGCLRRKRRPPTEGRDETLEEVEMNTIHVTVVVPKWGKCSRAHLLRDVAIGLSFLFPYE